MGSASTRIRTAQTIPRVVVAGCLYVNLRAALWALTTQPVLNSDFRGLWAFANFARRQQVGRIYQAAPLQALQHQLYPGFRSFFPFQYPPSFLLPVWWLGDFSYPAALSLWTLAGLAALIAAGWMFFPAGLRGFAIIAMLASPASLLNGVAGETGYFTSALLLAGFGMLPWQPLLAGVAFGLLTLKPQIGLLIPFALLARQDYRAMLSACLTALSLIALSCAVFPAGLWTAWLHQMPIYQAAYLAAGKRLDLNAAVTVAAELTRIGFAPGMAWGLQAMASLVSAAAVFFTFGRAPYPIAVACLFVGTFLCAPHAYTYDTIPLIAAMLLLPVSIAVVSLCLVTYLTPYLLLTGADAWFVYAFPETLLFLGIIYLALRTKPQPNIGHEPVPATKSDPRHH